MQFVAKMSRKDIKFCKENLKNRLKDRKRVRGFCFSYSKNRTEFELLKEQKRKKNNTIDKKTFNEKIKNLLKNFKTIKSDIKVIDNLDKETKKLIRYEKLFNDKDFLSFNQISGMFSKFIRPKKQNQDYILQKSKINAVTEGNNFVQKKFKLDNDKKTLTLNFYSTMKKINSDKKKNEAQYNHFFNLFKRNQSSEIIKKINIKNIINHKYSKKILNEILNNANKNDYGSISSKLSENDDISSKIENTIDNNNNNNNNMQNYRKSYSSKIAYKNKLIKHIFIDSNKSNKKLSTYNSKESNSSKINKKINTDLISLKHKISFFNSNLKTIHKSNIFLKSSKNINPNKTNFNEYNKQNQEQSKNIKNIFNNQNRTETTYHINLNENKKNDSILSLNRRRSSTKNLNLASRLNINNKANTLNIISDNNDKMKIRRDNVRLKTVINKPMYTAKIGDFIKNYNRIKSESKMSRIKRKENHLMTFMEIDNSINIKEDMKLFLLKDKYLKTKFPQKKAKTNNIKRKEFLKKFIEKYDVFDNPFNNNFDEDF